MTYSPRFGQLGDCATRPLVNLTKCVKRMGQCCTDEDDQVVELANNWSKPSICGNSILFLGFEALQCS